MSTENGNGDNGDGINGPRRSPSGSTHFVQSAHIRRPTPPLGVPSQPATLDDVLRAVERLHKRFENFVEDQGKVEERVDRRLEGLRTLIGEVIIKMP